MIDTQSVKTLDAEMCTKFLRWIHESPDKRQVNHLENLLKTAESMPYEAFVSGLKATMSTLEEGTENPLARIGMNPLGIFQTGLLLGYCMSRASVHPEFATMLIELQSKTENVTSIRAARKFK